METESADGAPEQWPGREIGLEPGLEAFAAAYCAARLGPTGAAADVVDACALKVLWRLGEREYSVVSPPAFAVLVDLVRARERAEGPWPQPAPVCELPPEERDAVLLRAGLGVPAEEVAALLGTTPARLRRLQLRAVQRLAGHEPVEPEAAGLVRALADADSLLGGPAAVCGPGGPGQEGSAGAAQAAVGAVRAAVLARLDRERVARAAAPPRRPPARRPLPPTSPLEQPDGDLDVGPAAGPAVRPAVELPSEPEPAAEPRPGLTAPGPPAG